MTTTTTIAAATATRCHFEFLDEHTVAYNDGRQQRTMTLRSDTLAFQTLIGLSVYVVNTPQKDCWPGLIQLLGRHLFEFLLPDKDIRGEVRGICAAGQVHINLSFREEASRYAQLPWEFLSVPVGSTWRFLSKLGENVTITLTRHVPMQQAIATLDREVKVLVDVVSPRSMTKIESRQLEEKLNELEDRSAHRFKVRVKRNRTLEEIRADLETWKPDIFHWSGHGDRDALWLAGAERGAVDGVEQNLALAGVPLGFKPLPPDADAEAFKAPIDAITDLFGTWAPRLVVLDACGSDWSWLSEMLPGVAHQLVARVPAVIAMRYPIDNDAASTFAINLYQGIAEGRPLDQAVQAARNALAAVKVDRAYGTPVLYLQNSLPLCSGILADDQDPTELDRSRHESQQPFTCVVCRGLVRPGRPFCAGCGTRYRCEHCNETFAPEEVAEMNFCPACGHPVTDQQNPARPRVEAVADPSQPPTLSAARDSELARSAGSARGAAAFRGFRDEATE